jgi:hypothetical protein
MMQMLDYCKDRFNLAIWTASEQTYADTAIALFDPNAEYFPLSMRLYRTDADVVPGSGGQKYYKDIRKLGFDLSKVVLIDNSNWSFYDQTLSVRGWATVLNGILVNDMSAYTHFFRSDKEFYFETNFLGRIFAKLEEVEDVRETLLINWLAFHTQDSTLSLEEKYRARENTLKLKERQ